MLTSANKIGYAKQFLMQLVQTVRWHKTMLQLKLPLRFMLVELSASFFFTVILLLLVVLLPNNYKIIKHFLIKKKKKMRKEFDYSSAEISCALFCRRRWKIWFHFWFPDFINPKGPQTCTPSNKACARARTACWLSDTCTCRERSPLLAYKHIDEHLHPICCSIDSSLLQSPGLLHWWRDIKMYALNLCFLLKQSLKACCTLIYN